MAQAPALFRSGDTNVPAHIANDAHKPNLNAAAQAGMAPSIAVIGIRGRNWWMKYKGETEILTESPGLDRSGKALPPVPVRELPVIIVGIASHFHKVFYLNGYDPKTSEGKPPDCFSTNGKTPDAGSTAKQHNLCETCPQNQFGSRMRDAVKAKACRDKRAIALVPSGDVENELLGGPMLLPLPWRSLQNLERYSRDLAKYGTDMSQVHTVMKFSGDNPEYPEIEFEAVDFIRDPDDYALATSYARSEQVQRMLNETLAPDAPEQEPVDTSTPASPLAGATRPAHVEERVREPDPEPAPVAPTPTPPAARPSPFARSSKTNGHAEPDMPETAVPEPVIKRGPGRPPKGNAFSRAAGPVAEAAEEQKAQAEQVRPVVQGAPADMESVIDDLLK